MARLGELLVAAGLLTVEQVEQALRAQVMWGGRLGTNLVELGYLELDRLAEALGRQHRLPPALGRHFDRADAVLQGRLSPDVAERFTCVPLMLAKDGRQVIVAGCGPLSPRARAIIADELGIEPAALVLAIAAELRIKYHLERAYGIPRGARFLRPRGKTIPPFPQFEIDPLAFEDSQVDNPVLTLPTETAELPVVPRPTTGPLAQPPAPPPPDADDADTEELDPAARAQLRAELQQRLAAKTAPPAPVVAASDGDESEDDDGTPEIIVAEISELTRLVDDALAVPEAIEQETSSGRERRRYVRTLDAPPATDSERQRDQRELGRIAIRRVPAVVDAVQEAPVSPGNTLGEATRAIRRSQDRDRVADLVLETLFRFSLSCEAALLMVVRGDAAQSWKGFTRSGALLAETAVPLDHPGVVPRAVERNATVRSPASDLGPIDQLLLVSLGQRSGDLVAVPVSISGQVLCVIVLVTEPEAGIATAESIAAAAGAAFARLMRYASR